MNLAYGKVLIDSYRRAKNEQMATRARLKNARSTVPYDDLCDLEAILYSTYDPILENLREEIKIFCNRIPIYREFLSKVKGLDVFDSLELLVYLKDIRRFDKVSKLWSYSGLSPVYYCRKCNKRYFEDEIDAKLWAKTHLVDHRQILWDYYCRCKEPEPYHASNRKMKGLTSDYNEKLKKIVIVIADKLSKKNDYYKEMFVEFRRKELMKEITSIHADNRSRRKVAKLFLEDLFVNWKEIEREEHGLGENG